MVVGRAAARERTYADGAVSRAGRHGCSIPKLSGVWLINSQLVVPVPYEISAGRVKFNHPFRTGGLLWILRYPGKSSGESGRYAYQLLGLCTFVDVTLLYEGMSVALVDGP